ncbi:SPW repeat protein [Cytobacillus depressus]|nr:SPW repeat protein [Cytobacillus depressus]
MKIRSLLNALIGIWFFIAPWVMDFSDQSGALWLSLIFGAIQVICALCGYDKFGWRSWQNWIVLLTGIWFIIFPFIYSLSDGVVWSSVILGIITAVFSLWNMGSTSNSTEINN